MPFSVFQVLAIANLIFKEFFKSVLHIQVLFKPVRTLELIIVYKSFIEIMSNVYRPKILSEIALWFQNLNKSVQNRIIHMKTNQYLSYSQEQEHR